MQKPIPAPSLSSPRSVAGKPEIIAVVLPDGTPESVVGVRDFVATGTMLLVRHADGRMALEPAHRDAAWAERTGGCFRKSKPIVDPVSREVMGYEMEMVPLAS